MKVKVIKDFKLNNECTATKGDILDLITINSETDTESLLVILLRNGQMFSVYFIDADDANKHIEFDYKEEICSAEVYITKNESNRRVAEVYDELQKKIEYWKSKCMKLIEMI